jgi:hypothetical protein
MENKCKEKFIKMKKERREKKRTDKRSTTGEEVIFIFEKILEGWKTIRIYNTIIQKDPKSQINKKKVETISTGNCKVCESELSPERYTHYLNIREQVYEFHRHNKINKNNIETIDNINVTCSHVNSSEDLKQQQSS